MLLKTSSMTPFLENACCNDRVNSTNPMFYFNEENAEISVYIHSAAKLAGVLKYVKELSTSTLLYHPGFTGIRYPAVPLGHLEENIYAAILWYCNFDRNLPIPMDYTVVCNAKPEQYDSSWTIQEKIEFLKKNGKRYGVDELNQLMTLVRRQNIIAVDVPKPFTQVDVLKDIVEKLDSTNSTIIAEPLREHLRNVLDKYDPKKMVDVPSSELDGLTNYLLTANSAIYNRILPFFDKHGKLSDLEYTQIHKFLSNIHKWDLDRPMSETKSYFDEGLYTVSQFIQNSIQNFSKIYPTILVNNADFFKNVPKHWGLSPKHQTNIANFIEKYYAKIEKFKGDAVLLRLLNEVSDRLVLLNLFAQNIPIHTEVVKEIIDTDDGLSKTKTFHSIFDKLTTYQLLIHCFYSAIYEYISCICDVSLLRADVHALKKCRRIIIGDNANESNTMQTQLSVIDEELAEQDNELQEIQIDMGNTEELADRVSSLLVTFLDVEEENKSAIDLSYKRIIQIVNRSKEKEKQRIVTRLDNMSKEELSVEDDLKKYRLGIWNVGQQKGLVEYDPKTYDKEHEDLMQILANEETDGVSDIVTGMMLDVYDLERAEEDDQNEIDNEESIGIGKLGTNFMDGGYYEEDIEEEDDYF